MCFVILTEAGDKEKKRRLKQEEQSRKKNQGEIREKRRVACGEGREERDCTE